MESFWFYKLHNLSFSSQNNWRVKSVFSSWILAKFGGTSLQDVRAFERSAQIIQNKKGKVVAVLSASATVTNSLMQLALLASKAKTKEVAKVLKQLQKHHYSISENLGIIQSCEQDLQLLFSAIEELIKGVLFLKEMSPRAKDRLLSFGERLSSCIFNHYLQSMKVSSCLVDARELILTDSSFGEAKPILAKTKHRARRLFTKLEGDYDVFVTQGFIASDSEGNTTTLGRGGSDYSASLIAEALGAKCIEVWTDVAAIMSADPRYIPNAKRIEEISFNEASEMAVFGAKVLHPSTLLPAMRKGIPVYVASSFQSEQKGTWIKRDCGEQPTFRALSVREGQVLLTISSPDMLLKPGFIVEVFQILAKHEISVDLISTSEVSVSITVNFPEKLNKQVLKEVSRVGFVELEDKLSLIAVIGNRLREEKGSVYSCFQALSEYSIKLICQGASEHNICFLVPSNEAQDVVKLLHERLINSSSLSEKQKDIPCLQIH